VARHQFVRCQKQAFSTKHVGSRENHIILVKASQSPDLEFHTALLCSFGLYICDVAPGLPTGGNGLVATTGSLSSSRSSGSYCPQVTRFKASIGTAPEPLLLRHRVDYKEEQDFRPC
jgi:hypothetical protein